MIIKRLIVDNEDLKVQQNVIKTVETSDKWKKHRLWLIFVSIFVVTMIIATSVTGYWLSVVYERNEDSTTPPPELSISPEYELPTSPEHELPTTPLYELSTSPAFELSTSPAYELSTSQPYELFKNRSEWGALPPKHEFKQLHDVKLVIIAHSATSNCSDFASCATILQSIQSFHMNDGKFDDIGYNFMVGGDGVVYEGRGYHQGAHTLHYNENSICICFIGDFTVAEASERQLLAALHIIQQGLRIASINPQYVLCGQLQLRNTNSPGYMLYKQIMQMPHWLNDKRPINIEHRDTINIHLKL